MRSLARAVVATLFAIAIASTIGLAQSANDPALELRLKRLETELRCLVCQNQTLADSNASLADDLRREVRSLAAEGKDDEEIKRYLVARYGDFILYKPPVRTTTWLLWFGPFGLLAGGAVVWFVIVRRRRAGDADDIERTTDTPEDAVAQARQAIYEEP